MFGDVKGAYPRHICRRSLLRVSREGRVEEHNEVSIMTYTNLSAAKESRVINPPLKFKTSDLVSL